MPSLTAENRVCLRKYLWNRVSSPWDIRWRVGAGHGGKLSYGRFIFSFWGFYMLISRMAWQFCHPTVYNRSLCPIVSLAFVFCCFNKILKILTILTWVKLNLQVVSIWIFLISRDNKYFWVFINHFYLFFSELRLDPKHVLWMSPSFSWPPLPSN